jgi:hypothetical protein
MAAVIMKRTGILTALVLGLSVWLGSAAPAEAQRPGKVQRSAQIRPPGQNARLQKEALTRNKGFSHLRVTSKQQLRAQQTAGKAPAAQTSPFGRGHHKAPASKPASSAGDKSQASAAQSN